MMEFGRGPVAILAIAFMASISILPGSVAATSVDQSVDVTLGFDEYWSRSLELSSSEGFTFSFTVTGGVADFYLMDSGDYSHFLTVWQYGIGSYYFFEKYSIEDASSCQISGSVPSAGTYWFVIYNYMGYSSLTVSGHISVGMSWGPILIVFVIFVLPIILVVARFVMRRRAAPGMNRQAAAAQGAGQIPYPSQAYVQPLNVKNPWEVQPPQSVAKEPASDVLPTSFICPTCGSSVVWRNLDSSYYCQNCGKRPWRCPYCNQSVPTGASNCSNCGANI